MRKIKFRGQRSDANEWVYGDLIHGVGSKEGLMYILPRTNIYPKGCNDLDGWNVIPETVGQFTGLTDKNEKEIYEGDIVRLTSIMPFCAFGNEFVGQVTFSEFAYFVDNVKEAYTLFSETDELEIIGNIHDNPSLLTNKE